MGGEDLLKQPCLLLVGSFFRFSVPNGFVRILVIRHAKICISHIGFASSIFYDFFKVS